MIMYIHWSDSQKRLIAYVAELRNYLVREMQVGVAYYFYMCMLHVTIVYNVNSTCMNDLVCFDPVEQTADFEKIITVF